MTVATPDNVDGMLWESEIMHTLFSWVPLRDRVVRRLIVIVIIVIVIIVDMVSQSGRDIRSERWCMYLQ